MKKLLILLIVISSAMNGYLYDKLDKKVKVDNLTKEKIIRIKDNTKLDKCLKNLNILREYRGKQWELWNFTYTILHRGY